MRGLVNETVVFSHEGSLCDYVSECQEDILWRIIKHSIPPNANILEAGAGSGKWLAFLDGQGYTVRGIELNLNSVRRFNAAYPDIKYDVGDVRSLPYADKEFSAVLSLGVLEHFIDGPDAALKEMARVLKDDGVALISVPHANALWKVEKLKDLLSYRILGSNLIRKLMRRKLATFGREQQKQYFNALSTRLIEGLDYKLRFDPSNGTTFYEYRFRIDQLLKILETSGFRQIGTYLGYPDQRLYQVFGLIAGRYCSGKGVKLNKLGRLLLLAAPDHWIAHMVIIVAAKGREK